VPAESESQRKAAGAALGAKRGGSVKSLRGASKGMYESMTEDELEDFSSKSLESSPSREGEPSHVLSLPKATESLSTLDKSASLDILVKTIDVYLKQGINPLSVPPEKRFYNPRGIHTGPRGGKFSVVGTEVDPNGNPINPSMGGPGESSGTTVRPYVSQPGQKIIEGEGRTVNGSPAPSAPSAQEEFNPDKGGRWDLNTPTAEKPWDPKMPNLEGKLPSGQRWPPRSRKEMVGLPPEDIKILRDAPHGPGVTQYPHQEEKGAAKGVEQVPSSGTESRWKSRYLQDISSPSAGGKTPGKSFSKNEEGDLIKSIDKYLSMERYESEQ